MVWLGFVYGYVMVQLGNELLWLGYGFDQVKILLKFGQDLVKIWLEFGQDLVSIQLGFGKVS